MSDKKIGTRSLNRSASKNDKDQETSEQIQDLSQSQSGKKSNSRKKVKVHTENDIQAIQDMANIMRIHIVESTQTANSGHPTSSSSCADFIACLFFSQFGLRQNVQDPKYFGNDRLVLSKGHAVPALYAAWAKAGFLTVDQLSTLRSVNSNIEGHPTCDQPFVDVATGSLGQGLGVTCGMAYASKYFDKLDNHYYCIMGDAEIQEGSVWEACHFASHYKLDNIIAFVDCNKYGQSNILGNEKQTLAVYKQRFEAFGWNAVVVEGHDIEKLLDALEKAKLVKDRPTVLIGKTYKGRNFGEGVEDNMHFHGKPLGVDQSKKTVEHLKSLIKNPDVSLTSQQPIENVNGPEFKHITLPQPNYQKDQKYSTREGYGNALTALAGVDSNNLIVGLDADLKNSTFADKLFKKYPEKYIECFIAEQDMVSVGSGVSTRGRIPFCSTFACFLSRAYDQIRMAGISQLNIKFVGSHCGISIGEDGSSQMGLEDLAMFRAIPNSVVLYPSDAVSAERAVEIAANTKGIFYIRTGRQPGSVFYNNDESFEIGKSKTLVKGEQDQITIVGGGVTVQEALTAQQTLAQSGVHARVVDIFSVKPVDRDGLLQNAQQSGHKVLVVEDHYPQGGLFESVASALADTQVQVYSLAVNRIPKSGKTHELFELCGISHNHIVNKVKQILNLQ